MIEPDSSTATEEKSADALSVATAVASLAPPQMEDVLPTYLDVRNQLLTDGRSVMNPLLSGNEAEGTERFAPDALALLGGQFIPDFPVFLEEIQKNIVHMEFPEVGAIFDGQIDDGHMSGFFHQGGPASFELNADDNQTDVVPHERWTGHVGASGRQLPIEVTFSGTAEAPEASLSIPSQNLNDHQLSNVTFEAERPIGELREERALPLGQATNNDFYSAAYAWDNSEFVISAPLNSEGLATGLNSVSSPPLPNDPAASFVSTAEYHLPFKGTWLVIWGGNTEFQNYHAPVPVQRHAYDLVIWHNRATYSGDGTKNEQYHAWGQPVLMPTDGPVVEVLDGLADLSPNMISDPSRVSEIDPNTHPAGNLVIIQTGEEEFLLIAQLQQGSNKIAEGDRVTTGDVLGLVGSSGNSSEPHIHIHLQSQVDFSGAQTIGLPLAFANYIADGVPVDSGSLRQGQLVAPQTRGLSRKDAG